MNDVLTNRAWGALALLAVAALATGCERRAGNDVTELGDAAPDRQDPAQAAEDARVDAAAADADDTRRNVRDRDPAALTPFDQKENDVDRTITQKLRQAVVGADGLSMDARNVKIITADGVVTLRGPVDGDQERTRIVEMAKGIEGVKRVDDRLEVARD